jgi:mRNA interferase RelE/StbE
LAWTINYTETARKQLRKLDKQTARRILDFMDERIASQEDPRSTGKTLTGPLLRAYWRSRVGDLQDSVLCILVIEIGNRKEIYR